MVENIYLTQAAGWLRAVSLSAALCVATIAGAQDKPQKPVNLNAEADYSKVTLTWENPDKQEVFYQNGFEGAFPTEEWSVQTTNTYYYMNSWFQFPSQEMEDEGIDAESKAMFIHNGDKSMLCFFDQDAPHTDGTSAAQDEWLKLKVPAGAEYVNFYTFINPIVLTWGANEEFPDHYLVRVSHDGGENWEDLWDARYDSNGSETFQHVSLYLGQTATDNTMVAFQAVSNVEDPSTGLYLSWAIDDVELTKTPTQGQNAPDTQLVKALGKTCKQFVPKTDRKAVRPARRVAKAPAKTEYYNVYRDDELLGKAFTCSYVDEEDKETGSHVYGVEAVSDATGQISDRAETTVSIGAAPCNPPSYINVTTTESTSKPGFYDVDVVWDAPLGDRPAVYYDVFCNGARIGWHLTDLGVGQTGKPRGVYKYSVVAYYEAPDGESEPAVAYIACGTRYNPTDFVAEADGDGYKLTWSKPTEMADHSVQGYNVYRGSELLGNTTELSFTDANAPAGAYDYAVTALYEDGFESIAAAVSIEKGTVSPVALPLTEDFNSGMKPANWKVVKEDGKMQDQYLWRFDNLFNLPVEGDGFSGKFASTASSVAGLGIVSTRLVTPAMIKGDVQSGEKTYVEFDLCYNSDGQSSLAGFYYSYDGEEWTQYDTFEGYKDIDIPEDMTCLTEHYKYDITDLFAGNHNPIYFSWMYKGKIARYMAVDNAKFYNEYTSGISTVAAGKGLSLQGDVLNVSDGASSVKVYTADGTCVADLNAAGKSSVELPLASGVNIVRVDTSAGIQLIKIVK